jgi:hypothetical protein
VAGSLVAAAAAVGIELSTEVAAIIATGLVFTGMGALEGGLSDLAIQGQRVGYFHDQGSINWNEVLQYTAVGGATAGVTFGAGTAVEAGAPALGRIAARLTGSGLQSGAEDPALSEASLRGAGGLRSSALRQLSDDEIQQLKTEFQQIGGDPSKLEFNVGARTGYADAPNTIRVRGDVLPTSDPNAIHPRSTMSTRAVLAHELGHAHFRGTGLQPGHWADEFRASYWAARNVSGLSIEERINLIQDALSRAAEKGIAIKNNRYILELLYGIRIEHLRTG